MKPNHPLQWLDRLIGLTPQDNQRFRAWRAQQRRDKLRAVAGPLIDGALIGLAVGSGVVMLLSLMREVGR